MDGIGALTLRTHCDRSAQKVFLEVSDTGCGISKENLPNIFDPFLQQKSRGKVPAWG